MMVENILGLVTEFKSERFFRGRGEEGRRGEKASVADLVLHETEEGNGGGGFRY